MFYTRGKQPGNGAIFGCLPLAVSLFSTRLSYLVLFFVILLKHTSKSLRPKWATCPELKIKCFELKSTQDCSAVLADVGTGTVQFWVHACVGMFARLLSALYCYLVIVYIFGWDVSLWIHMIRPLCYIIVATCYKFPGLIDKHISGLSCFILIICLLCWIHSFNFVIIESFRSGRGVVVSKLDAVSLIPTEGYVAFIRRQWKISKRRHRPYSTISFS